ncbi:recombinase family protein [Sphingomonas bacterium]|uniref:recombinase zinc beta ribbon domain-containing protein n=1 Tax=Sphingomonas bacterium TaxID=1895847 RepID=UPI0015752E52|nr:recombinase family protein [Sphingomonas bacterium]
MNEAVFSIQYARWSDPSQGKGTSKARQFAKMREEAARNDYACQREIFDDGRSAFHGHHIERGKLGVLLDEIDAGALIGWVLQIENIDRLSRQGHTATLALVNRILQAGVSIHTCDGEHLEAYQEIELLDVITLSLKADLANKEAKKRQDRAASSWAIRRDHSKADGRAIPGAKPAWIERVGDENKIVERLAAQARRVWEMADETGHGAHTITRLLNVEGVPMFDTGKPWYASRVDLILSGMEVIGYHQPRRKEGGKWVADGAPIKVYPAIIPHDLFKRVRDTAAARLATHGGGKSKRITNLLSGLCRCESCGRSMRVAGSSSGGYLMCSGRDRGLCDNAIAFPYRALESTVLDEFLHLALDDDAFANKSEVTRVNAIIAERETDHRVATEKAKGLLTLAAQGSRMAAEMAFAAEAEANAIAAHLQALKSQREAAMGRASAAEHIARLKDMRGRLGDDIDLRRKVLQAFNTVIQSVAFSADGITTLRLVGGIITIKIDLTGTVIDGEATLTLNDDELAEHRDRNVVNLVRAVTHRFAKIYERAEANWSMNATATG